MGPKKGAKGSSAASSKAGSVAASRAPSAPTSPVGATSAAWGATAQTLIPDAGKAKAAPAAKPAAVAGTAKPPAPGGAAPAALSTAAVFPGAPGAVGTPGQPGAPGVPSAPKPDKVITQGADAFIYEEYGFPSAAEPVPSVNPLLILSVMVAYLLLVAAGFLIIKYAYHGYDIDAPDAHTVTKSNLHDPLPIDETVLKGGRRHREDHRSTGRPGRGAAGRGGHRRAAHGVSRRRHTAPPTSDEEEAVTQWAPADYMAEVLDNHEPGAATPTGSSDSTEAVEVGSGDSQAAPPVTPARRRSARPKNLNKTG